MVIDIIQKQITIFGPTIAIPRLRQIPGVSIEDDGTIMDLPNDPRSIMKTLVDQFNTLSPSVVKKTMKPIILLTESIADLKKEEQENTIPQTEGLTNDKKDSTSSQNQIQTPQKTKEEQ